MHRRPSRETGIALVFVIFALTIVAGLVITYLLNSRVDAPRVERAATTTSAASPSTKAPGPPTDTLKASGQFIAFPTRPGAAVSKNTVSLVVPRSGGKVTGSWAIRYEGVGSGYAENRGALHGEFDPPGTITGTSAGETVTPSGTAGTGTVPFTATLDPHAGTVKGRIGEFIFEARIDDDQIDDGS